MNACRNTGGGRIEGRERAREGEKGVEHIHDMLLSNQADCSLDLHQTKDIVSFRFISSDDVGAATGKATVRSKLVALRGRDKRSSMKTAASIALPRE